VNSKCIWSLLFLTLVVTGVSAADFAEDMGSEDISYWHSSFSVSDEGYNVPGVYKDGGYLGLSLGWEPFQFKTCDPLVTAGVLFNGGSGTSASIVCYAGLGIELFTWAKHPLSMLFTRPSTLTPVVELSALLPNTGFADLHYRLVVAPLRFSFGFGSISILEPIILFKSDLSFLGWGGRLFSLTNYIW